MTEKEKMLNGDFYDAFDEELANDRMQARKILFEFNSSDPSDPDKRKALLDRLFRYNTDCYIEPSFHCDYGYNIILGKKFYANSGCVLLDVNKIIIGDLVQFGPQVQVYTATHPVNPVQRSKGLEMGYQITIGDNVWIGGGAIVLPGITIGKNTVIGAGSVVTKNIPENVLAAGNCYV